MVSARFLYPKSTQDFFWIQMRYFSWFSNKVDWQIKAERLIESLCLRSWSANIDITSVAIDCIFMRAIKSRRQIWNLEFSKCNIFHEFISLYRDFHDFEQFYFLSFLFIILSCKKPTKFENHITLNFDVKKKLGGKIQK